MSFPKAFKGDDEYAEVRPKRLDLVSTKIPTTNPLNFAEKSTLAVGPSRGFEAPPQAMEVPHWEPPISPQTHSDFPYPSKGSAPPPAVLEHPMKAKGYMKHAEMIKRELEDMQDKFGDLMSHAKNEELRRQCKAQAMSRENKHLEKKTRALELEVDSLKTGKEKPRKGDELITDIKGILNQNEQLYQANNKWGTAYHDLEDIYQKRLDEEEKIRKKMEMRAKQLAIENHCLKNKFSDYGKGKDDMLGGLGISGEDGEFSDNLSNDSLSSDESDMDKLSLGVRDLAKARKERRKMWKDLYIDEGKKGKSLGLRKTEDALRKKMARIKKIEEQLGGGTAAKLPSGGGMASLLKGGKPKKQVDMEAPDMRALMDHVAILHKKLDRYRDDAKSIEGENKRLKDDMEFMTRRYQSLTDRVELGGRGGLGPGRGDLMGYGGLSDRFGMNDRLFDYY
ncbi:hypothetical protein LOD99_12259 [Oopsacas minuta]|uniref:Uncharacterized protein n=1 Tax=Oopsacas minuta TaxID=111878 RepID=A0AAV7JET0_9METZ|nr:hypothetical protein LOD99_12259 [Oopsacas minuta]